MEKRITFYLSTKENLLYQFLLFPPIFFLRENFLSQFGLFVFSEKIKFSFFS